MKPAEGVVLLCECACDGRLGGWVGALKSDNTSHYECYPPPGLAVKGTGITLGVTTEGAGGVGVL